MPKLGTAAHRHHVKKVRTNTAIKKYQNTVGKAERWVNDVVNGPNGASNIAGRELYIEAAAKNKLARLNGYDKHIAYSAIQELAAIPAPIDGLQSQHDPMFNKAKLSNGALNNFAIKYTLTSNKVIVTDISHSGVIGPKADASQERNVMYHIEKIADVSYTKTSTREELGVIPDAWRPKPGAVNEVKTLHAAVNGQSNNLKKAAWLMGVHASVAYKVDKVKNYTLFHNPTQGGKLDTFESAKDKMGMTTSLAKHLAAVLLDVQRKGQPVKWVAHSQGAAIFMAAVKYHNRILGTSLGLNSVALHAGAHNKNTDKALAAASIKKESDDRNNPFDLVPNILGAEPLTFDKFKKSFQFKSLVTGENNPTIASSPHTLPFLSLESYHRQLKLAGLDKKAAIVKREIDEVNGRR